MLLALILVAAVCFAVAGMTGLAVVLIAVRREDRRKSLKGAPVTRAEAATRRLLGVGVRQPENSADTAQAGRR
jgi:hypothetical protein